MGISLDPNAFSNAFTGEQNAVTAQAAQKANENYQQQDVQLRNQQLQYQFSSLMQQRMMAVAKNTSAVLDQSLANASKIYQSLQTKAQAALNNKDDPLATQKAKQIMDTAQNVIGHAVAPSMRSVQMLNSMFPGISSLDPKLDPTWLPTQIQGLYSLPSPGESQSVAAAGAGQTAGAEQAAKNAADISSAKPLAEAKAAGAAEGAPQSDIGKVVLDLHSGKITPEQADADLLSKGIMPGQTADAIKSGATGEDLLKMLPPAMASQVKAYAEGRMQLPTGYALKTPYMQQVLGLVSAYDPQFDATNYQSRASLRTAFTSGSQAQNVNGIATAAGHLHDLVNAVDNLQNSNYPLENRVGNWILQNKGDPRVAEFLANREAITSELTRAWRGAGGAEADIQGWKDAIDQAGSPEAVKGVVGKIAHLLDTKANALNMQFNNGMGNNAKSGRPPVDLVGPDARKSLESLKSLLQSPGGAAKGAWRLVQ